MAGIGLEHHGFGLGAAVSPAVSFLVFSALVVLTIALRGRAEAQSIAIGLSCLALGVTLSAMRRQHLGGYVLPVDGRSLAVEVLSPLDAISQADVLSSSTYIHM